MPPTPRPTTPCQQAVAPSWVPEGRWPFGCLEGPTKTPLGGAVHEIKVECCYGGGKERVWTGCRGAQETHIPALGPVGQVKWKRISPHLSGLQGDQCPASEQSQLGHGFWFPGQCCGQTPCPQGGPSLLPNPQGPQAKFLVGRQPAQITTHTNHTCFFLYIFFFFFYQSFHSNTL